MNAQVAWDRYPQGAQSELRADDVKATAVRAIERAATILNIWLPKDLEVVVVDMNGSPRGPCFQGAGGCFRPPWPDDNEHPQIEITVWYQATLTRVEFVAYHETYHLFEWLRSDRTLSSARHYSEPLAMAFAHMCQGVH